MSLQMQINFLVLAVLILVVMQGVHSYLLLKGMGDTEKFGRLLRKVRRALKGETPQ